jgi:hypothetical protein
VTRLLPLLIAIAAVAVAGCGSSATSAVAPAAPAAAAATPKKVRTLPKKVFVRRANRICRRLEKMDVGALPAISSDVARNRRVVGAWFGRVHAQLRRGRRQLVRLGQPSRDRARWRRAMAKITAVEQHVDTMRAAAWSGSVTMLRLSARELLRSNESANRRLKRFGADDCAA